MGVPPEVDPLVRHFASNGFKYLFSRGDNAADLLGWRVPELARRIDFARLTAMPDTFVAPGFTQLASDVLLRAPFRGRRGSWLEIFVLIENQAQPDGLMGYRALRYVLAVYERQMQEWLRTHDNSPRGLRFDPVLPVVFYSGARSWEAVAPFAELVREGGRFGARLPAIEPVFVNLARAGEGELVTEAGALGSILHMVQQRGRDEAGFREVVRRAVRRVDQLPERQRERFEHLLWYAHALVYHERGPAEGRELADHIRQAVCAARQGRVEAMGKSFADVLREEGEKAGQQAGGLNAKRATLLRQMRLRFKAVPAAVQAVVESEQDEARLDAWLDAVVTARRLSDMAVTSIP